VNVVISQSMYFPWVGLLEQIRLADVFVHYDDVQFTRGFYNRVQVKTEVGARWMTVPLRDQHRGELIDEVRVDNRRDWRDEHHTLLKRAYAKAPYFDELVRVFDSALGERSDTLADVSRKSVRSLAEYFGLNATWLSSRDMNVGGSSSQRLHDLVKQVGGSTYVTGHGARNYLDHELFERSGIAVEYMAYQSVPYPQLFGAFTPFVTGLDLVANCGRAGAAVLVSESTHWRGFVNQPA
jgi:hypothetical protein